MTAGAAYSRLREALANVGPVRQSGTGISAQCPSHEDHSPSLSIRPIEGSVLLHCHAGCTVDQVLEALRLSRRDLFDDPRGAEYRYPGGRIVHRSPDKRFRQSGDTADRSLFRLEAVKAAIAVGRPVYVVEGEKDVLALESVGAVATCSPMGAGKWTSVDSTPLHGGQVVVVADRDEPGRLHASQIAESLRGRAHVVVAQARAGKDAADHVGAGFGLDEFEPIELQTEALPSAVARRARVTWADQIEPEPVDWAWRDGEHGRIPSGALSMAAGREGTGKSSFGVWTTAHITRGTLPGSLFGTPRNVFYVAVEDSWKHTLVPRLIAAGADLAKVGRFDVVAENDDELTLSLPHDNALLEQEVRRHGIALVVIDPLMSVIGERIDTHRERDVRSALDPLAKIADRTGSVILGIAHFNKGTGTDAASLITGSGAFKNVPRAVFGFARDDSDDQPGRVMSQVKNSLGRDDLPSLSYAIETAEIQTAKGIASTARFTFLGESDRSVADILRESRAATDDHDERRHATAWLLDFLANAGGEAPAKDVFKAGQAEGYSRDALKRAKGRQVRSTKAGMSGGWVWQLIVDDDRREHEGREERRDRKPAPFAPFDAPFAAEHADQGAQNQKRSSSVPAAAGRSCGHPGDPNRRCGTCLAQQLNESNRACEYCGKPAESDGFCAADDEGHRKARGYLGLVAAGGVA